MPRPLNPVVLIPGPHPTGGRPGRGIAGLEAGGQVFGEGGGVECAAGEPVPQAAERTLVGAAGVGADRSGGELVGSLSRTAGREPRWRPR